VIKNPLTYEIMTPESVGVPESRLVLGKHSGRHALQLRCEGLGYRLERRDLDRIYRRFVALADRVKTVEDAHIHAIVREEMPASPAKLAAPVGTRLAAGATHA
jgi:2-isopropylmalate synthase